MTPEGNGREPVTEDLAAARAHINAGRYTEAEEACRMILTAHPDHAEAWHLLGAIALQRGNADRAIDHCRRAIALAPALAKAHSNLGAALVARGQCNEAIVVLQTAVGLDPNLASAYVNLGDALIKSDRLDEAVAALECAVALSPTNALALANLGAALTRQNRLEDAIAILRKAIEQNPGLAQAHNNLGYALQRNRQHENALAAFRRAQELRPDMVDVYVNLGLVYRALGRFDEAIAAHNKALELRPGFSDAAFLRSLILLAQGQFAEGWQGYLDRFSVRRTALTLHRRPLASDLTGAHIVLVRDQGLGDEIFFLRFAPELKRRGAQLTYQANGKISSMLRRLSFLDRVVEDVPTDTSSGMFVSIGDLPHLLAMNAIDDIPPSLALTALPERLAEQRNALAALGPPPYIGVTWRAGTDQTGNLFKSVPLPSLGAVLGRTKGTLIALQRLPEAGEIAALSTAAGRPVHDFAALNDRLEDMLALLSLLDDYVTVSNTNVHLRAAVGKGSRVMVPRPPEFRWMMQGSVSPWFPDCTVYRQDDTGSWERALAVLSSDLALSRDRARADG